LILATASLGMAWSACQAALWDGELAAKYAQASPFHQEAMNQSGLADLDLRRLLGTVTCVAALMMLARSPVLSGESLPRHLVHRIHASWKLTIDPFNETARNFVAHDHDLENPVFAHELGGSQTRGLE
jgi:hypothetical protein